MLLLVVLYCICIESSDVELNPLENKAEPTETTIILPETKSKQQHERIHKSETSPKPHRR